MSGPIELLEARERPDGLRNRRAAFLFVMKYRVKFYTGNYRARQEAANRDDAICYVEHHFNAGSITADYSVCVLGSNCSDKSQAWARAYLKLVCEAFETKLGGNKGLLIGGYEGRGNGNVYYADMPSMLTEPLFISNPEHAACLEKAEARDALANCLASAIRGNFPDGGLVAFSVGHAGKPKPHDKDRGAAFAADVPQSAATHGWAEADYARDVLKRAATMLQSDEMPEKVLFSEEEENVAPAAIARPKSAQPMQPTPAPTASIAVSEILPVVTTGIKSQGAAALGGMGMALTALTNAGHALATPTAIALMSSLALLVVVYIVTRRWLQNQREQRAHEATQRAVANAASPDVLTTNLL